MSGSGLEALSDVREAIPVVREWWEALADVREWSGCPPGCPGVIRMPSQMFGSCRETLPDVWELLVDSPGCPGVVVDPPGVRELSVDSLGCPAVVGKPSRMSGSCR